MRRTLLASLGAACALLVWAGAAAADTGSPAAAAAAGAAPSVDAQTALGLVAQLVPAGTLDETAPVDDAAEPAGSSQANGTIAGSLGANGNETGQTVEQQQGGAPASLAPAAAAPAPPHGSAPAPAPGATQVAGQSAESTQTAEASADATQIAPTNDSVSVRIGSPGDNGDVTQANDAIALAGALNANTTTQGTTQSQGGPGGGGQIAGQSAKNDQWAGADAEATQIAPSNKNVSVRIFSPGNDGAVSQSSTTAAGALAANGNATGQTVEQSQAGPGGSQIAGQSAQNEQVAVAGANAKQVQPRNENISVRIFSPGDNGPVSQSNTAVAGSLAGNANTTTQSTTQSQAGTPVASCASPCGVAAGRPAQVAAQSASSTQCACADATATQIAPSNENQSIRVGSPGADGPVTQSNGTLALAGALNGNTTTQTIGQSQSGSGGTAVQAAGQKASNAQQASATADAVQVKPSNVNAPVRVWSPGAGGAVEQTNAALAGALAANLNGTTQGVRQGQAGGGGTAVQAAGQLADSRQSADADANAAQCCAANVNAPARVFAWGSDADVSQTNVVGALAVGLNGDRTGQAITQSQGGADGAVGLQAAGQKALNDQDAAADAEALQLGAVNRNRPVAVGTPGRCPERDACETPDRCDAWKGCDRGQGHVPSDGRGSFETPGRYDPSPCGATRRSCERTDRYEKRTPCEKPTPCEKRVLCPAHGCKRFDPCGESRGYGRDGLCERCQPQPWDRREPPAPGKEVLP